MSRQPAPLPFLLEMPGTARINLEAWNVEDLKTAARFWFGSTVGNKLRRAECVRDLEKVLKDPLRVREALVRLPENERQLLAVCKRYGGTISGTLLLAEGLTRDLLKLPDPKQPGYLRKKEDPVHDLLGKMLLFRHDGGHFSRYDSFSYSYRYSVPDVVLPTLVRDLLEPAAPLGWPKTGTVTAPAEGGYRRAPAAITLDLWTVATALHQGGSWKTNRGGSLAKTGQNRLRKLFPVDDQDPLLPPAFESLYYELLRGMGAVVLVADEAKINLAAVEKHLLRPAPQQAAQHLKAWSLARLWQDGIGVVHDRDREFNPRRIEPDALSKGRALLLWGLCRVAHGNADWLDLKQFLQELWLGTNQDFHDFSWEEYAWDPGYTTPRGTPGVAWNDAQKLGSWLAGEGTWAANALLGTLAFLGLVERAGTAEKERPCFRLTELGRIVFAAPEVAGVEYTPDPKFLVVQPNHEVLAYLDVADARAIWPLALMARRVSSPGVAVQTFTLTRESVYQALESGVSLETIQKFLTEHSRTGLPANVALSLIEWSRKREALTLRTGVTVVVVPTGATVPPTLADKGRALGERCALLPPKVVHKWKGFTFHDHREETEPCWRVEEDGRVHMEGRANAVALARLSQFADADGTGWRISAASVARAREHGISAEVMLGWLRAQALGAVPALVELMVRNWAGGGRVFFGPLLMLQVPDQQAYVTIAGHPRFQSLLLERLPPNWLIVRSEMRAEFESLLKELGFSLDGNLKGQEPATDVPSAAKRGRPKKKKGKEE